MGTFLGRFLTQVLLVKVFVLITNTQFRAALDNATAQQRTDFFNALNGIIPGNDAYEMADEIGAADTDTATGYFAGVSLAQMNIILAAANVILNALASSDQDQLSQSLLEQAQQQKVVEYYEIIEIDLAGGIYITNAPWDITYNSDTYKAFGNLLAFDSIEENTELEIPSMSLTVSGVAPLPDGSAAITNLIDEDYANSTVTVSRVYYENHVQQGVVETYKGYVSGIEFSVDAQNTSTVTISTSSHWADFARVTGRRTNKNSQQNIHPGDNGMNYSIEVQKEIVWK